MNAKIFSCIVAKEKNKFAALSPVSPAASMQLAKMDKQRQMSKMVKAKQPTQSPASKPSVSAMM